MQAPQKSCKSAVLREPERGRVGVRLQGLQVGYCGSQERRSQAADLPVMVLRVGERIGLDASPRCRS